MPGGLLRLVCYGNENAQLNGNPETTWFYKVFQKYTHFSQEPIQVPLEGPDLLLMDSPILLKAKIPRQGDLLSDLVLRVQLPDIFSKAYISTADEGLTYTLDRAYEFAWVRQVGVRMIDTVTFTVGGQIIQEFNSDWISARALLDNTDDKYEQWRSMVGDTPEYFDPANGLYADSTNPSNPYPNVIAWTTVTTQNNAPSIPGRILRIPLGLWFSDFIANSLPLIALQYHDAEITIKMRPIRDLYTVLDPSGIRLRSNQQSIPYIPSDQYPTVWNPSAFGPLPPTLNNLYVGNSDPSGSMKHFLTDFGVTPFNDGWPLNATLEATFTFVTTEEQRTFAQKPLRYMVRQVQNFQFYGINTRNTHRLDVHNIATRIVYFARRSDAIPNRNQPYNLTNWINPQGALRPVAFPQTGYPKSVKVNGVPITIGGSGINIAGIQRRILRNVFITANGTALFDSIDPSYFTEYVPYRYLNGNAAPFKDYSLASQTEMFPLYTYSFALNSSSAEQPTGTLNTSRIDRLEMDVDVEPIPYLANYTYELQVFVETLNFLDIMSGLGGLKFAK